MMVRMPALPLLHRYLLRQFIVAFLGCLFAFVSLFLVFDFFDQIRVFVREGTGVGLAAAYLFFKIPLIVQLMTPMAMLLGTLLSVGRLAQLSEVTAMRACGVSVGWIAKPLLLAGLAISVVMFLSGETIVPWATDYVEELYHLGIRNKAASGKYSREHFWYRAENAFYNIGYYDSRTATLTDISTYEYDTAFRLMRRIDAKSADWVSPRIGWTMHDAVEIAFAPDGKVEMSHFDQIPLVIGEKPADFYNMQKTPESMSYLALRQYIQKLQTQGVPVTPYVVQLAAKISFPLVNMIAVLLAFPFALTPARSGSMTLGFAAGVSVGFAYYFIHAIVTSLGSAELIPVLPAAWAANVIFLCVGGYLLAGAESAGT